MLDDRERERLERAYRDHGGDVWKAIYAYSGGRRDVADEAVAEAFAQAGRRLARIRDLRPWLFRAAFRIAAGELKRRSELASTTGISGSDEAMVDLLDLIGGLTNAQRRAFVLRVVLGFSSRETATLMGSSEVAARVHLHGARRRLGELVREAEA